MNEQAMDTVTLLLDNDESVECAILCILPVQGKDYIALLPLDDEGDTDEESRVFLYRYLETEGEEPQLENIDDDEEFEMLPTPMMNGSTRRNTRRWILTHSD